MEVKSSRSFGFRGYVPPGLDEVPQVKRGELHCTECHRTIRFDMTLGFEAGWPKCCTHTMTIDSHAERCK